MQDAKIRLFNRALLLLGVFATLSLGVYAGGKFDSLWSTITLWEILPFLTLFIIEKRTKSYRALLGVTLLSILYVLSVYAYIDSLFIHPDAQGALVFLYLPFYQLIAIGFGLAIIFILNLIQKKK